jgi:MFS family permease
VLTGRQKALITLATLLGTFLAALDSTVVGTAMPTVIGELGGLELYPWAFASYLLAATVTGPIFGKLSDTYGRKPVYLAGIFLFLLGSVLCGTSQSMGALIFFRTIQELGLGFSSTSYLVSVQNAVPWGRRGVATSSVVFFRTVGGSLGVAVMGAFLNASLGERYSDAVDRAAGGDAALGRLLSDPNALLQPAVRGRIPDAAYSELAVTLAASLSPAFWVLLFFGISALAVATLFPRGMAKDLVSREEHG